MKPYLIDVTFGRFRADYKQALKKYPTFKDDISAVFSALENNPELGDAVPKYAKRVWKIRIGVKGYIGKSGGFRLMYHVDWERRVITPMFLYFKGEAENLPDREVKQAFDAVCKGLSAAAASSGPSDRPN